MEGFFPEVKHVLWTIINFGILLWLLNRFLFKPVLNMMTTREKEIEGNIAKAESDMKEAERLRQEFAEQLASAQQKAREIISQAQQAAAKQSEQMLEETRVKQQDMLHRAEESIRRERDAAISQLREEVASLAVGAAGKVIGRSLNADDHRRLVDEFVTEAGKN